MAKATRRDLRRAIGPAALDELADQRQALTILHASVSSAQREIASLALHHAKLSQRVEFLETEHATTRELVQFYQRRWRGRLRWLCVGWR